MSAGANLLHGPNFVIQIKWNSTMDEVKTGEASKKPLFNTKREDNWILGPLSIFLGLTLFCIYAAFRAFENNYIEAGNLLSPFFSPKLPWPHFLNFLPDWMHRPAILILWIPAGFRGTCYYFRKAYYRAFFLTPPACAVSGYKEPFKYTGETKFPWVLQNIHRYMFYLAAIVLIILYWDTLETCFVKGHMFDFGYIQISVGTILYFAEVTLLSYYSFGCHAFRHLIGGRLDCFSCSEDAKTCHSFWKAVTNLNEKHQLWAWVSLGSVIIADVYVRCVAQNMFPDLILFSMAR